MRSARLVLAFGVAVVAAPACVTTGTYDRKVAELTKRLGIPAFQMAGLHRLSPATKLSFLASYIDHSEVFRRQYDTRAFTKRFQERVKRVPTSAQAGVYSSVFHYLKAVKEAGTTDSAAVMKIMKSSPINDMFAKGGKIREDGRMIHDMYLFEVKKPSESKARWDDYKLLATIPGDQAFQSLDASRCPFIKK